MEIGNMNKEFMMNVIYMLEFVMILAVLVVQPKRQQLLNINVQNAKEIDISKQELLHVIVKKR